MNATEKQILKAAVMQAAGAAYDEDAYMFVGQDDLGNWTYRHSEDTAADNLKYRFKVGADGVHPHYVEYVELLMGEKK